jgi:hypothetical protein
MSSKRSRRRVFVTKDGKAEERVYGSYFEVDEDQALKKNFFVMSNLNKAKFHYHLQIP